MDLSPCQIIADIQKDPAKQVQLTIRQFNTIKEHVKTCVTCSDILDEIIEKYKDVPSDPNSDWDKSKYN